jgi:hypothetical protein
MRSRRLLTGACLRDHTPSAAIEDNRTWNSRGEYQGGEGS